MISNRYEEGIIERREQNLGDTIETSCSLRRSWLIWIGGAWMGA